MQGAFIDGMRPKSKKALREAAAADPARVELERTAWPDFGSDEDVKEFSRPLTEQPPGRYSVAGPDPFTDRRWYATVIVSANGAIEIR